MTGPELPAAIRYLPLVPRPRPAALPLQQRLTELDELVHQAQHAHDATEGVTRACEAMNKAALLASDTGHSDLAAALCWQQYETFLPAIPLTAQEATFALQPLVNLGRLAIRTGNPSDAYTLLESLLAAADHDAPTHVLGRPCPVGGLVVSATDRAELRRFLWAVLLADGTRALCAAGRWQDAVEHLHHYNGIGARLLDGRQVAVLSALHRRDSNTATRLLATTGCTQGWEHAVAACLTTMTRLVSGQDSSAATTTMVDAVLHLPSTPGGAVFAARLGVLACELAPEHQTLVNHVLFGVLESDDAHAANAVLGSPVVALKLTKDQRQALRERVAQAELAGNEEPSGLDARLEQVCAKAAGFLACWLRNTAELS